MKQRTKEQLEAEIAIHEKMGATMKVRLLKTHLHGLTLDHEPDLEILQNDEPTCEIEWTPEELSKLKDSGATWKEIEKQTGASAPWLRVAAWKKQNQQ